MSRASIAPIPPGALDLTGEAARRRRALQRRAMDLLEAAGYAELIPPTFEYEEIYRRAVGPDVGASLIRFLDLDGQTLALRYDFTSSVARVAATAFAESPPPLRFCYSGKVFRQEPVRGGRPRELLQAGGELLGDGSLDADREVLGLVVTLLEGLGLSAIRLNLGHAGVLAAGFTALPVELRATARRLIDRRDRGGLVALLATAPPAAQSLGTLPFVLGRREAIEAAIALTGSPPDPGDGLFTLAALDEALAPALRDRVLYDLGEVRGFDYYTGIHFEVFAEGIGRAIGMGGRYDDLMGRFGAPMPAVGFTLDLGAIAEAAA